jgi:hypothetical protein
MKELDQHRPTTIYLCGPRSGMSDTNIPLFTGAAHALRTLGYCVLNPVDVNIAFLGTPYSPPQQLPTDRRTYPGLRADIFALLSCCDGIALLPGWEAAIGCRAEVGLAITFCYTFVHWQSGEIVLRPPRVEISYGYNERNRPPGKATLGVKT